MIGTAYSQTIGVTGGAGALTFSIPGGSLPTGLSLNSSTGAITGTPTGATGTTSFTVKVTDSSTATAGPMSATQALSITTNPPVALTITTTRLLNPLVGENYNQTLQFSQTNATLPLTWSILSGTLPANLSLDASTGTITGIPTTTGTSPITVQLADSSTPTPVTTKQALSLTVTSTTACASGSEALLNGQYAMSMTGFDGSGPVGLLGSFTADGTGKITAGTEDINSTGPGGVQSNLPVMTAGSSYTVGSDNTGCLTLVAGGVTRTFRFTAMSITAGLAQGARILEFDPTGTNIVGTILIQDPADFSNSAVIGSYNFVMSSPVPTTAGGGYSAAVGVLTLNGTTVTGVGDINLNGSMDPGNNQYPASPISFTPGPYNITANGRGTLTFTPPGEPTINLVIYVMNGSLVMMSSDAQSATNPLNIGFAGLQTGGPYGSSSLNTISVLFLSGQTGTGPGSASCVEAGIFNPDGVSSFNFTGDLNCGGTIGTPTMAGTYTVAANGRVLLTSTGGTTPALILYLVNPNTGVLLSTDPHVMVGDLAAQTGEPFTNSSLSGTYSNVTIDPVVPANELIKGTEMYDGSGNVSATFDYNDSGWLSLGNLFAGTYTVSSNGRVIRTWDGATENVSYIISPVRVVTFGNTPSEVNPILFISQQ
jgi:hypothetical protein